MDPITVVGTWPGTGSGDTATGTVTFRPSVPNQHPTDDLLLERGRVVATLDGTGSITVDLWPTDDPGWATSGWVWEASVAVSGAAVRAFSFELPTDGAVTRDLADIAPAVPVTAVTSYALASHSHAGDEPGATVTGWGDYADTQYTEGSPFAVAANTDTRLPNNAGAGPRFQVPADVDTFYDESTQTITGRNGETILVQFEFSASIPGQQNGTYIELWMDIGGAVGELYRGVVTSFPKGANLAAGVRDLVGPYTLDTWEANGAGVWVRANSAVNLWGIRYVIHRLHAV